MGDDESIAEIAQRVPSSASASYGRPFIEIFEAAGRDFYKIDPLLFSPAQVVFQNLETGRVHIAGKVNEPVLRASFGIS
jgi:methenyltetrahydromethanopterin cyclohydrolase